MSFRPRSYHPRRRKLTGLRAQAWSEVVPTLLWQPHMHRGPGPVLLDIGVGMGEATVDWAAQYPNHVVVGVDIHTPGIANLAQLTVARGLRNVCVVHDEAVALLDDVVQPDSLDAVRLLFPDPWPKPGQRHRRIVQAPFATLLGERLRIGGRVILATDDAGYAAQMRSVFAQHPGFTPLTPPIRTATRFEQRGRDAGRTIADLAFTRVA